MKKLLNILVLFTVVAVSTTAYAVDGAKVVGLNATPGVVHCWQLSPFTDVACFDMAQNAVAGFSLSGYSKADGSYSNPVYGSMIRDPFNNNVWKLAWSEYDALSLFGGRLGAALTSLPSGIWNDSLGNVGDFIYLGTGPLLTAPVGTAGPKNN